MLSESKTASSKQVELHKSIFHWRKGGPSHCLLRIFAEPTTQQTVVVISSLVSNQFNPDNISLDLLAVVRETVQDFREHLGDNVSEIEWLLHYGNFSEPKSYATLDLPDEFVRSSFEWDCEHPTEEITSQRVSLSKLDTLYPWLKLPPVEDELTDLQSSSPSNL